MIVGGDGVGHICETVPGFAGRCKTLPFWDEAAAFLLLSLALDMFVDVRDAVCNEC